MKSRSAASCRSDCPVATALDILGDRWTLLIVRDMLMKNHREYGAFKASEEKPASNILADRLRKLEAHGVVRKVPHATDARKSEYYLTDKGLDLAPVLMDLVLWSAQHEVTSVSPEVVRRMKEDRDGFLQALLKTARDNRDRRNNS